MQKIKDYPDYGIYSDGKIIRLTSRTNTKEGNVISHKTGTNGYKYVCLSKPGNSPKKFSVHKLVIDAYGQDKPEWAEQVAHLDGNKSNNSIENLIWVTAKENASHKKLHGTHLKGADCYMAKLNDSDVIDIFNRRDRNESVRSIAQLYDICEGTVLSIEKGRNWKHLKLPVKTKNRAIGELHYNSKLKQADVLEIKKMLDAGIKQRDIAKKFNVSYKNISCIHRGKTWKT